MYGRTALKWPGLDNAMASARERKHSKLRRSSRSFPLKLSLLPFCQGLPGSIKAMTIPLCAIHSTMARLTNSGP